MAKLRDLLKRATRVPLTEEHKQQQRRSFAYGNTNIENCLITREMVDAEADALDDLEQEHAATERPV